MKAAASSLIAPFLAREASRQQAELITVSDQVEDLLKAGNTQGLALLLARYSEDQRYASRKQSTRHLLSRVADLAGDPLDVATLKRIAAKQRPSAIHRLGHDVPRFLVLERSGMAQDLQHGLLEKNWSGVLLPLVRAHLKQIAGSLLGFRTSDFQYIASTTPEARESVRAFFGNFLALLFERTRSRAILTANIAYWSDQELPDAAQEAGGQLLVLHKESLITSTQPSAASYVRALKNGVTRSPHRRVAVYSESTAGAFVTAGVADRHQITVTGAARLDAAHSIGRERSSTLSRQLVTFFSFSDWIGIDFPGDLGIQSCDAAGQPRLRWTQTLAGFFAAAELLSRRRSDIQVVVKHKGGRNEVSGRKSEPASRFRPKVVRGGPSALAFLNASAVCVSFNSTVILEALAARVPVIVPAFGEAALRSAQASVIDFGPSLVVAESPDEIVAMAANFVDNPVKQAPRLTPSAREALDRLIGNPDGKSGERLQSFLAANEHL